MASSSSPAWLYHLVLLFAIVSTSALSPACATESSKPKAKCNIFKGRWVEEINPSPAYNYTSCPFIRTQFDCQRNGRPDSAYLNFRWQPDQCSLKRFDAHGFLERFRGKRVLFVGDSLMLNQWQSLTCMIQAALGGALDYSLEEHPPMSIYRLPAYDISISMQWHQFLVEIQREKGERVLKLDDVKGDAWRGADLLVFDSYHWWYYRKPNQPWDSMELGGRSYTRLDRTVAFKIAMEYWERWVDRNLDHAKTKVFYQGISPSHYRRGDWGRPGDHGCAKARLPITGDGRKLAVNPAIGMVKSVLSRMRYPAAFLDIWHLSLMRPDAHPSLYTGSGPKVDCTHWCLPGLPDTWNHLLYTMLSE